MRSSRLILSLPLSLSVVPTVAHGGESAPIEEFRKQNAERQPLDQALIRFGVQSGISIIFDRRLTDGKNARPIDESLPPFKALSESLLENDLRVRRVRDDIWAIVERAPIQMPRPVKKWIDVDSAISGGRETLEKPIVVTGTRIQREDLNALSPVHIISSNQLVLSNTVNSEQYLNTLPQVVPSFDQTSNNPGDGSARVDLRGLGAVRTLVLVDGARFVGLGPTFVVDINNIPSALVERIDVVTGGASAVYGSDAVAGVVNFIMKKDFEGIQLDASHELSAAGWDANTTNVALTVGGNFGDGRGNAVVLASYTNRNPLINGDRAFSSDTLQDAGAGATTFSTGGSGNIPQGLIVSLAGNNFGLSNFDLAGNVLPSTNTNFAPGFVFEDFDPACGAANANSCSGVRVESGGSLRGVRFGVAPNNDQYNYAPANYLQLPQERFNISALASYEINDHIEAYMRGVFSESVVDAQLAPTPAGLTLTVNLDNPALTALPTLLSMISGSTANNGNGTATVFITKRYEEVGFRNSLRDTTGYQILTGIRGDLNDQWSYDTFFNFSRSTVTQVQTGNISSSAVQAGVLCDGGPTSIANACTAPYVDLFGGQGGISAAGATFIGRTGTRIEEIEQTQWVGRITGDVNFLRSPWSKKDAAVVLGLEYRELFARTIPDSALGPDVRGFNPVLPVGGRYDVYEAFGEVQIPVITDKPFFDSFAINGAYRYSDYSITNVGGVHTFAVGGDWSPISEVRFRAQFQRAVRAPNIFELFAVSTLGFPTASDPCSGGPNGDFSTATIASTCIAAGVPAAVVGANIQPQGQVQILTGGNPNLTQETGDTLTVGMVWQPEAIDGLSLQIDYFGISIKDAITTIPVQTLLNECHLFGIASACSALAGGRNPNGVFGRGFPFVANIGEVNASRVETNGIDANASYSFDVLNGSFSALYYGTYVLGSSFKRSATSTPIECAGLFGPQICSGGLEPLSEYKHTVQVEYTQGPFTANLRWRALSGVDATVTGLSDLSDDIGFFNYLDVTTQYAVNENLDLTVGVRNITGKDAPLLGSTVNEQGNTWPATYTPFGRQLFFGASLRF